MERDFKRGPWEVRYCPDDGGRIALLRYGGVDLLTTKPESFAPPAGPFGIYEQRPVYGYDDCFPTVDACSVDGVDYADHGELWQRKWNVKAADDALIFSTYCDKTSAAFTREMIFEEKTLCWRFGVKNCGNTPLKFMHVMHPLIPTAAVRNIGVCEYERLTVLSGKLRDIGGADELFAELMNVRNDFCEVMLSGITRGSFSVDYTAGLRLTCDFSTEQFPHVNIWWNNGGHPATNARREFAIEPTVGPSNSLADLAAQNRCMNLAPSAETQWRIIWRLDRY